LIGQLGYLNALFFSSELEAQTDGRVDGGSVEEATGHAVRNSRIHGAGIGIKALGESVIDQEGDCIELPAARRKRGVRAADRAKAVLLLMEIGGDQIDIRPDGVFRAGPEDLEILGIRKAGIADRTE